MGKKAEKRDQEQTVEYWKRRALKAQGLPYKKEEARPVFVEDMDGQVKDVKDVHDVGLLNIIYNHIEIVRGVNTLLSGALSSDEGIAELVHRRPGALLHEADKRLDDIEALTDLLAVRLRMSPKEKTT